MLAMPFSTLNKCRGQHLRQDGTYTGFPEQREQLTAFHKVHYHVQVPRVLKSSPKRDQERMLDLAQHLALIVCVLHLLHLDDLCLLQHLDGVEPLVVPRLDQVHSAETTGAEGPQDLEVSQRIFSLSLPGRCLGLGLGRLGGGRLLLGHRGGLLR